LSKTIVEKLLLIQTATQHHKKIILNICLNYGGQQDILQAAQRMQKSKLDFNDLLLTKGLSQIDLLIRTGNEKRLSNFML
jgi:undecaprenyl diphosphate synthase